MTEQPNTPEATAQRELEDDVASTFFGGPDLGGDNDLVPAAPSPPAEPVPPPAPAEPGGVSEAPAAPPVPAVPAPAAAPAPPPASPTAPAAPQMPPLEGAVPAPPVPAAPTDAQLKQQSLEAQVTQLTEQLEALRKQPEGTAPSSAPATDKGPEKVSYALTLPNEVAAALDSDEPATRVAAITHIVNSLAGHLHTNIRAEIKAEVEGLRTRLVESAAAGDVEAGRKASEAEYFKAFPGHNDDKVRPVLTQVAKDMAKQYPGLRFDAAYIAALGTRVNARLAELATLGQPTPTPAPPPPPPPPTPKPAAMLPSGTRTGGAFDAIASDQQSDIDSTFSW